MRRLEAVMDQHGYTDAGLARQLGVSGVTITLMRNETRSPGAVLALQIEQLFDGAIRAEQLVKKAKAKRELGMLRGWLASHGVSG